MVFLHILAACQVLSIRDIYRAILLIHNKSYQYNKSYDITRNQSDGMRVKMTSSAYGYMEELQESYDKRAAEEC